MGRKLSRHVNHPPESVPALSQTCWSDMKRRTVNLYRMACQTFLFLKEKEKLLNIGIWFDKSESCQVASDKVGLGAMWVDLPTRMSARLPCSLDTVPRALSGTLARGCLRSPSRDRHFQFLQHLAPGPRVANVRGVTVQPGFSAPSFDPAELKAVKMGPRKSPLV